MQTVQTFLNEGIFEIALNRPQQLNAINQEFLTELKSAVAEAKSNPEVRVVLLYGNGRGFCAGGDLKDFGIDTADAEAVKTFLQLAHETITTLYRMEKPVIAAVHGPAVGAGCNLAFACDIIFADETATFSQIFSKVGALPDLGGLYFLPQKIGMHKAAELIFTGKKLNGKQALEYGLINEVTNEGESLVEAKVLAEKLARAPTKAIGLAKRIMHQAPYSSLETILELEALGQAMIFQTGDFKEGKQAFQEKRKPIFLGK